MQRLAMLPLAGLLMSGNIKAARIFDAVPLDLTLLFALAVLLQCYRTLMTERFRISGLTGWVLGVYALIVLPAALWTPASDLSDAKLIELGTTALLSVLAPLVLVRRHHHLAQLVLWMGALGGVATIDALLFDTHAATVTAGRLGFGAEGSPLVLGRSAAIALVALATAATRRDIPWWLSVGLAPPLLVALLRSGSQGPALSVFVGIGVVLLAWTPNTRHRIIRTIGFATIGTTLAWFAVRSISDTELQRLVTYSANEETRLSLWLESIRISLGNPAGVGWGAFESYSVSSYDYPHNVWVEGVVEAGWIAGALFIAATVLSLRLVWRSGRSLSVALYPLGALGVWATNAAFTGTIPGNRPLLGLMVVAALTPQLARASNERPQSRKLRQGGNGAASIAPVARRLSAASRRGARDPRGSQGSSRDFSHSEASG